MSPCIRTLLLPLAFASSVGLLSGCRGDGEGSAKAAPAVAPTAGLRQLKFDQAALERLGVKVAPAGRATGEARLTLPGTIDYDLEHYAEVGTPLAGRVSSVLVRVGDRVRQGQALATVIVPAIAEAQADYIGARASVEVARGNAEREKQLLAGQLTTAREKEVAVGDAVKADAQLRAATARLTALGVPLPTEHSAIHARGALALTAPLSGVVVGREAILGGFLEPNDKAFVVADPRRLVATIDVYESDLPFLQINAEVTISVDALNKTVHGRVALIEPHLGAASRTLRARVKLDNADGVLRPGLFVKASLPLAAPAGSGPLVPAAAVQPVGGELVVFIEKGPGVFDVRPVRLGRRTAQVAEIVEGVQAGEPIAVEGTFLLRGEVTRQ